MNSEPVTHLNWVFFCEISLQLKVINSFDKRLHFKIYYGVLNLPRILFQIHILLAVLLWAYSINHSIVHLFPCINSIHTCIHVFTSPFSILSFSDGMKSKFAARMTYMKQ